MDDLLPCRSCKAPATGVNLREVAPFVVEPARTQRRRYGYAAQCGSRGAAGLSWPSKIPSRIEGALIKSNRQLQVGIVDPDELR